jgi:hypothetical protein
VKVPWTDATATACGIDALRRALAPGCGFGRSALERRRAFAPGDEPAALAAMARVLEVAHSVPVDRLERLREAIAGAPDPLPIVARAGAGEVLSDADFFDLVRFGDALAAIAAPARDAVLDVPRIDAKLAAALAPGRVGGATFYLDDAFEHGLASARGDAARRQAEYDAARSRLSGRVAGLVGLSSVREGEFVVMRDALPAPLPEGLRVLREAPTYVLCELALDSGTLAALAARDAAVAAVAVAEERVRERLSAQAAAAAATLARTCERLGELDLLAAAALFAARNACVLPDLAPGGGVAFAEARFPPLVERLAERGRRYVPISLELDGIGVVTGPNMGGKTAALRTLGFLAACAVLGVPVPARSARLPLFAEIAWLGIALRQSPGDQSRSPGDQSRSPGDQSQSHGDEGPVMLSLSKHGLVEADAGAGLLSAFGSEVVELRDLLMRMDAPGAYRPSLVLIDEFAQTTSPPEGRALLVALLQTLRERDAVALAATHFGGVAAAAGVARFAIGGSVRRLPTANGAPVPLDVALARIANGMNYALERRDDDEPAPSGAFALATELGLDAALVVRAEAALRAQPG